MPSFEEYFPGVKDGIVTFENVRIADLGDILDSNGNEQLQFDQVASAVNNVEVTNSATGNNPKIQAVGDDTNVSLDIDPKGTGTVDIGSGADDLTVNGVIVPQHIEVTLGPILNGNIQDDAFFIATQAYEVTAIDEIHSTAESGGTVNLQVERLQGTEAPGGNGDALLTNNSNSGFDGTGTANTVQNGTLTGTTANLQLSAGDRLGVDYTGDAPGELDGVVITVTLKRI